MKYCLILFLVILLGVGCTLSVNLIQSEGKSDDKVEESITPTVDPAINIPAELV